MPEGGFTTDGQILRETGEKLHVLAEWAGPLAQQFSDNTDIPTAAYGNQSLPPALNFTGRLVDLLQGDYDTVRTMMTLALQRTSDVLDANANAVIQAGVHYELEDLANTGIFRTTE